LHSVEALLRFNKTEIKDILLLGFNTAKFICSLLVGIVGECGEGGREGEYKIQVH